MTVDFHVTDLEFGQVISLDGMSVLLLASELRKKHADIEYAIELGSFILIQTPLTDLVASVSAIRLVEDQGEKDVLAERRTIRCALVGFLRNGTTFERGIERYPTIGSKAYFLTEEALMSMFQETQVGIPVGARCQRGGGQEYARIDRLFGRHSAVLGTSGSGKSWTVASILQQTMKQLPNTRILFLDIHDEYRAAFPENFTRLERKVSHISSTQLRIPYWALTFEELTGLFLSSEHTAQNQSALLASLILELRSKHRGNLPEEIVSVDSPVYFDFKELIEKLRDQDGGRVDGAREGKQKAGPWNGKLGNLILRLETKLNDPRYGFLFSDTDTKADELTNVLDKFFGVAAHSQLTAVDLSGLPSEVLSIIVGVICRLMFDYKYWDIDPNTLPITIVLEEAHNYLPRIADARHQICLDRVERVAKEGRKYGVGLMVVSQRPSELSETVLSQCANFIVLRLTNPNDQAYVRKLLPDFLAVAVDMLPYLRTGEAVLAGEAVALPSRVRITPPDPAPRSEDVAFKKAWESGLPENYAIATVVERWRNRNR